MWELDHKENWASKNWCLELWCWRRLLRVSCTARRSNQSILEESTLNIHWKDSDPSAWSSSWSSNTLVIWCEDPVHGEIPQRWERSQAGGEGDNRRWDGWMASSTRWTWVWASSRNWWWTGKPGELQSMGSQRVGHDLDTEQPQQQQQYFQKVACSLEVSFLLHRLVPSRVQMPTHQLALQLPSCREGSQGRDMLPWEEGLTWRAFWEADVI